jgi:hypothetical protein
MGVRTMPLRLAPLGRVAINALSASASVGSSRSSSTQ